MSAFQGAHGDLILEQNTGPNHFDTGYAPNADAFLWGRIDFLVTGNPGLSTHLTMTPGFQGSIVHNGQFIDATFGTAAITVAIPEPTSVLVIAFMLATMTVRRR